MTNAANGSLGPRMGADMRDDDSKELPYGRVLVAHSFQDGRSDLNFEPKNVHVYLH